MKIEKMQAYVDSNLEEDDQLVGFFWGMQPMKLWLFAVVGPFAALSMKFYVVSVSQKGLHFHRVNVFEKFADSIFFSYDEVETLNMKKGMLNTTLNLHFDNGRKIKLKVASKGKGAILSETTSAHLLDKFPIAA